MPEPAPTLQETTEILTITGRVAEVDADSLVVETMDGRRMTFPVDRDLTQGPDPVRVGSQVRVEYRGERELQVVKVSPVLGAAGAPADDLDPAEDPDPDGFLDDDDNGTADDSALDNGIEDDDNGAAVAGAQTAAAADPDDDGELPGTASPLPLLLMAGLSLLGGGVGLSARRRR
jgi:hypothetical protein